MSLLLSEGHTDARHYTVAYAWTEARIVRQRISRRRVQYNGLMQMVIGSMFDKKAGKQLQALLKRLDESD